MDVFNVTILDVFGNTDHYDARAIKLNDDELTIEFGCCGESKTLIGYIKEINIKTNKNYEEIFTKD